MNTQFLALLAFGLVAAAPSLSQAALTRTIRPSDNFANLAIEDSSICLAGGTASNDLRGFAAINPETGTVAGFGPALERNALGSIGSRTLFPTHSPVIACPESGAFHLTAAGPEYSTLTPGTFGRPAIGWWNRREAQDFL